MSHSAIAEISQQSESPSPQLFATTAFSFFPTLPLEHQQRIYHTAFLHPEQLYQSQSQYQSHQEQEPPHDHDHLEPTIPTFHLFPNLPPELRAQNQSGKLITARSPHSEIVALWICHESRHAALRVYKPWNPLLGYVWNDQALKDNGENLLFPPFVKRSQRGDIGDIIINSRNIRSYVFISLNTDLFCLAHFVDMQSWMYLTPHAEELLGGMRNLVFKEWEFVPMREEVVENVENGGLGMPPIRWRRAKRWLSARGLLRRRRARRTRQGGW